MSDRQIQSSEPIQYWLVSRRFIRPMDTERSGPYSETQLVNLVRWGRIHPLSLIDVEPRGERFRAEELPFLRGAWDSPRASDPRKLRRRVIAIGILGLIYGSLLSLIGIVAIGSTLGESMPVPARALLLSILVSALLVLSSSVGLFRFSNASRRLAICLSWVTFLLPALGALNTSGLVQGISGHQVKLGEVAAMILGLLLFIAPSFYVACFLGKKEVQELFTQKARAPEEILEIHRRLGS